MKPHTAFYSWQSDTPNKTNRAFIEDALREALRQVNKDAAIVSADRPLIPVTVPKGSTIGHPHWGKAHRFRDCAKSFFTVVVPGSAIFVRR